jgi:hypothetical protein
VRVRAAALLAVLVAAPAAPARAQAPPRVPPLAFRSATLVRADHTIEVRLSAAADVGVRIGVSRGDRRLGQGRSSLGRGTTVVPVAIGPRAMKPLRAGLHVNVAIYYGDSQPLRTRAALLLGAGAPLPVTA